MKYKRLLKKINKLQTQKRKLSDLELQSQTGKLRKMILEQEKEENVVIEAFATLREANRRVLNLFPTDEQVLGALALYYGNIAEIKTGEGKSLVATMTLYLKALYMKHVFLVTTNDYLARRDYLRVGDVYKWMGVKVSDGTNDTGLDEGNVEFDFERKKEVYSGEIIYISNATLGFDYLISALSENKENQFISPLNFALLDEVDQILLDSAQQPLIISGGSKVQSNYFEICDDFVKIMIENQDFKISEEKDKVWFTSKGIEKAKWYFSLPNLLSRENFPIYQHLVLALKANHILKKDRDYIVEKAEVKLLDRRDGRILEGNKMQSGLHQAIEAKEKVEITAETQTISSITYQNLFRRFKQLSGMSGTVKVAEDEFINTYNLKVVKINTHKRNIRRDHKPQKYVSFEAKLEAIIEKVRELYDQKRSILLITGSVEVSELFSMYLLNLGIPHNVLNAKSSVKEALIIKGAGRLGAVTIATSMAGRGTDIKLSKASEEQGGLAVIITERMLNKRMEFQAKGRAGRQGEPGDTYSFESLEDDVIRLYMQNNIQKYYDRNRLKKTQIRNPRIRMLFRRAQKISDDREYDQRLNALKFDNIFILQKNMFDKSRADVLKLNSVSEAVSLVWSNSQKAIDDFFEKGSNSTLALHRFILDYIDYNYNFEQNREMLQKDKRKFIQEIFNDNLKMQQYFAMNDALFLQFIKACVIKAIDISWSNQVEALNQLMSVVEPRSSAQKKPIIEFEKEARKSYENQVNEISKLVLKNVSLSRFEIKKGKMIITLP